MQTSVHLRINRLYCLITLLFTALSTQAQTYTGHTTLTPTPASLRVIITALSQSPVLRIRYENQANSPIRLQIRDRKGRVLYDEQKQQPKYAGEFDMSLLPAGVYNVDLRTNQAHYQETVRVELLGGRYPIITTTLSEQPAYVTTQNKGVANQLNK